MIPVNHFLHALNEDFLLSSVKWKREKETKEKNTQEGNIKEIEEKNKLQVLKEYSNALGVNLFDSNNEFVYENNKKDIMEQISKKTKKEVEEKSERLEKEKEMFEEKNKQTCIATWNIGSLDLTPLLRVGSCSCTKMHGIKQVEIAYLFIDKYPTHFYPSLLSHFSKITSSVFNRLKITVEQIIDLNPDILFLQEIKNGCTLKILCSYLNYHLSWMLGESKEYYVCMIEKDECKESVILSYNEAEKKSMIIDANNSGTRKGEFVKHKVYKDLKGALVRKDKIQNCKMFVPVCNDQYNNGNPSYLKDQFILCDCFFAMQFTCFSTSQQICENDSIMDPYYETDMQDDQTCDGIQRLSISESHPIKEFNILALVLHLRSLKNPENVFIRDMQIKQMKEWVEKELLEKNSSINPTHLMILGDMNDYDSVDTDINENKPKIQVCGQQAILEQLKLFFLDMPLSMSASNRTPLVNTSSLRPRYSRFTNSYIYDLSNPSLFYGAICHILVSPNFPLSLFSSQSHSYLSKIHAFKLLPFSVYELNKYSMSEFTQNILNNKNLMEILRESERETVMRYCSMNQFRVIDFSDEAQEQREKVLEKAETVKERKLVFEKMKRIYIKYLYKEIETIESKQGLKKMPNSTYASDHVPVYFYFK